jgi:DUF4097 and DUF4098 domain-containing protein YvlB
MAEPKRISITTRSGKVRVTGVATDEVSIIGGFGETNDEDVLEIRREPDSDEIEVICPSGTDVTIGTTSGNVETHGVLGSVRILTVSGKIHVAGAARIEIRTKSGKVDVRACEGECKVVTTSSKVHIGTAGNCRVAAVSGVVLLEHVSGAEVQTVSGKVLLGTSGAGDVSVKTVSGKVEIRVPSEIRPATHLKSVSGKVQCDCESGDDGTIAVKSLSGAIRLSCA